jgi:hypothetical protein
MSSISIIDWIILETDILALYNSMMIYKSYYISEAVCDFSGFIIFYINTYTVSFADSFI